MKIQTYNDGEGVTTIAWMDANFNPVEPGSDDARYVKFIASTGELSFYYVNQDRAAADWDESQHPRDDAGKFTDSGGNSRADSRSKLTSGKKTSSEQIHGSANGVHKITLKDDQGNEVETIFKPTSGESWTIDEMTRKAALGDQASENKEEFGVDTAGLIQLVQEGAFDSGEDEPLRETITNRDFSYAEREVAAYEIDKALGLDVVPPTVVRKIDGELGMVQEFVETQGLGLWDSDINQDSIYGLAIIDIATGNTDRHAGNVLIDKNRRVVAIDQGLTFPNDDVPGIGYNSNYQFRPDATLDLLSRNSGPMSDSMAERVAKSLNSTDWENFLDTGNMSDGEIDGFIRRMNRLKTAFSAPDAYSRSIAVRTLIHQMAKESNIARNPTDSVLHVDGGTE